MGHPVTTNPMVIMIINMTVVFLVLIVLMYLIQLIHFLDPTKKKSDTPERKDAATQKVQPTGKAEPPRQQGIPEEVVAVISAAIASCDGGSIRAIRPLGTSSWRELGRIGR